MPNAFRTDEIPSREGSAQRGVGYFLPDSCP